MIEISKILTIISEQRPVFHSEADFQHAFAWEIHRQLPEAYIRLELPVQVKDHYLHVDVWIINYDEILAVELKYKTRGLSILVENEQYSLKNQVAQDLGRYDFIKDIQRLEHLASEKQNYIGYAILLTNDSAYWKKPAYNNTVDADFRLDDTRILEGSFNWGPNASFGTKKNREQTLVLQNRYPVQWEDFSRPSIKSYGLFRSLIIKVPQGINEFPY